jgi:hypothetical protein
MVEEDASGKATPSIMDTEEQHDRSLGHNTSSVAG